MSKLDQHILLFINQSARSHFFNTVSIFLNNARPFIPIMVVVLLLLLVLGKPKTKLTAIFLPFLIAATDLLSSGVMKPFFARIRPCHTLPLVTLNGCSDSFSFPSSHAANSMAFATFILLHNRNWGYISLFLALVISFSRLYLGVHYPSDILGGWIVGISNALVFHIIKEKIWSRRNTAHIVAERSGKSA